MNQFKVQLVNSSSFKILLVMEYVPVSAQKKRKSFFFFFVETFREDQFATEKRALSNHGSTLC